MEDALLLQTLEGFLGARFAEVDADERAGLQRIKGLWEAYEVVCVHAHCCCLIMQPTWSSLRMAQVKFVREKMRGFGTRVSA